MTSLLRLALLPALAGSLLAACGSSSSQEDASTDGAADTATPSDAAADGASGGDSSTGRYVPAGYTETPELSSTPQHTFPSADMVLDPTRDYAAVIETDVPGRIVVDLTEAQTPITVNSFVFLARNHYFDGIAFHRVIDGFVAQGGDPNTLGDNRASWGTGGPGYQFGLEIVPALNFDARGVLGMARTMDPNSNGSQFFITLAATPNLDGMYTVFGHVIEGDSVLDGITRDGAGDTPPATPTRMTSVYIVERPR